MTDRVTDKVKASELIKEQKERESKKKIIFDKIYVLIERKIVMASKSDNYFTWFQIPEFMVGLSLYSFKDCVEHIQNKLKNNGFKTEFYKPNILYIDWNPNK